MKRVVALFVVLALCLSLCACGKSESVKNVEEMINAIGEVSMDSESAVVEAEKAYAALTAEEKETVENHTVLTDSRTTLDSLILEHQKMMKYVGEWVYISDSSRNSITFSEDYTWKKSNGSSGNWSLVEDGLALDNSTQEWTYEEYNSVPRLTQTIDATHRVLVKKEYASVEEHEINIDNWQEYFEYKRTYSPHYDPFGDLESFSYLHWLALKPEYAERLVYGNNEEYKIAIEFSGTLSKLAGKLDLETGVFSIEYIGRIQNRDNPKNTLYDWALSQFCLDSIYVPEYYDYDYSIPSIYGEYGYLTEFGAEVDGFLENRGIGRIQGSILLYDYPVHKMPDYANALAQFTDSEVTFAPVLEGGGTYIVKRGPLNSRTEPSYDGSIIIQYPAGEKITIFEQKDGWGRTHAGWVNMQYVQKSN